MLKFQTAVLGGGSGGYVAAIRLGQLGKETVLIEKDRLGGVCLNVGCIPSKALIRVARVRSRLQSMSKLGLEILSFNLNLERTQTWKQSVVDRLTSGIQHLCEGNNVKIVKGDGSFKSRNELEVNSPSGSETIAADQIIIATGSRPIEIPGFSFDGENVITSTEALALRKVPGKFVVIGGGVTGLEIATMFAEFGSNVTVLELMDQLLPGTDPELVKVVERTLNRLGVTCHVKAKAEEYREGKVYAQLSDGSEVALECEKVMVAVGRRPNSDGIGLENIGAQTDEHGRIQVNRRMETTCQGVYAIGDVTGPPMLAHKASKEGIVAAEVIAGINAEARFRVIPSVIFTDPEIASVGLTESEAKERGYDPIVGRFPFIASGRAILADEYEGFVKVVADRGSDIVLGVHIVGAEATDVISEAALAIEMGATLEDIGFTMHPHPTLPEALMEAAENAKGKAIHILQR